jgi:probable phosphomutase (TIGR03848 family)
MHEIFLIRHGRSTANNKGVLAGRLPGIELDAVGIDQARAVAKHLSSVDFNSVYSSPLPRCLNTAKIINDSQKKARQINIQDGFNECDYGAWSGKKLSKLASHSLWKIIQDSPSQVKFPQGEAMTDMSHRSTSALLDILKASKSRSQKIAIVSHADVIKSLVAFAMGLHLDNFQRLIIDPASVSKINWTDNKFYIEFINNKDHLSNIVAKSKAASGAVLGGGAG